jgi:DNA-binding transcriptional LysR family regulator
MDLRLSDVALFVRIVELGSLSAAARERNAPVSLVSRGLARLEAACGVRLLHRTTHALSLTDEGDAFLARARLLLETAAEMQGDFAGKRGGPSGWVRVSVSPVLAQTLIVPSLPALYERHPQLHVEINADDRIVDMARDAIDIAIRTGTPAGEQLVARPIGELTRSLYAAPSYLGRRGAPQAVADLALHHLLANSASPALNRWTFDEGGRIVEWAVQAHTRSDDTAVILALAVGGVGIARITDIAARPFVASGQLVEVLAAQHHSQVVPMYAVMLEDRQRLPKVRACIEHWAAWTAGAGMARRRQRRPVT